MSNLKPCPFCGSPDVQLEPVLEGKAATLLGEYSYVNCLECEANGPSVYLSGSKHDIPKNAKTAKNPTRQAGILWNKASR